MLVMENWWAPDRWAAVIVVGLGLALLALGAQLYDAQRSQPQWPMRLAAAAAAGTGLWWPLHVLCAHVAPEAALDSFFGWMLVLAGCALTMLFARAMRAPVGERGPGLLSLPLAFGVLVAALWLLIPHELLLPVVVAAALATPLVAALWLPRGRSPKALGLRLVLALAAALAPVLVVALQVPQILALGAVQPGIPPLLLAAGLLALQLHQLIGRPIRTLRSELEVDEAARLIDGLTRLATRVGIERELTVAAAECDAHGGRLALMIIDIDAFNPVNSSFGHEFGDKLLAQVAERLRTTIGPHDVAGRIGGDDFVVLHAQAGSQDEVGRFATHLLAELCKPYQVDGREISLSCSGGLAQYPDDGGQTRMLACAEAAKNAAKRMGGGCHCFYLPGMDGDAREQLDLLGDLRHAVERNELELFFQPKIDALSGQVTAAEALLRWRHPSRGLLSPTLFIPIAERYGFMVDLGNWVIVDACRQARIWRDAGLRMRVAINLSAQQMRQPDVVDRIADNLEKYRVHPSLLTCEITESVAMEDTAATQNTFQRLGHLGVHLSIDDFGTGYSSLSYLRRLPAAELKIDRAFITDITTSQDARSVVDAVIKLAHALSLRVVAEGVETQEQQAILTEMGCDELQGFLFSLPMSAQAIQIWAVGGEQIQPAFRASLFGETTYGERSL